MPEDQPVRISVDELTAATFSGVLRALEERRLPPTKWPGPILAGIIWWPELGLEREQLRGSIERSAQD